MRKPLIAAATAIATALSASAATAAEVNVYTTRQPELIQPIFDAFTAQTGIDVNVLYAEKGLIERMKAEGDRSPADLYMTADISNVKAATDAGLTQPHGNATVGEVVPATLRDEAGHWFALTTRARVAYTSKERVAEGEVTTFEDLADPKWRGRICARPGSHSYNLALIAAVIAHHGEADAKVWVEGLRDNLARKPQGNDRAQVKAVWAGECDIAIGNTYYMGKMLEDPEQKEWADSVRVVFPTFEGGGAHVNISGAALTRSAPNKAEAEQLIDFLLSPEAQELYASLNHEYPVRAGVEPSDLVNSWGTFEPDTIGLTEIGSLRGEALKIVEETQFDLGPNS
ncbi:Fe(3+) ABC transporter substrate-binding protein [Limibaculum sp. M0105]|uniref:Fe(3+) ABC transporter substrate-binding protein n=1 Tax=Thermohalobaculum xanthum TaxID=2753746 RepID=A0A8J7SC80_9RHOB|nr:Fe(3+) ABC transporter substrate-binding protein [Thermohalobaculum xanthum]MBK0397722.1 Fe(3+) ABC transporter substrate-binding protein [Thermohalobaculum xanthum]